MMAHRECDSCGWKMSKHEPRKRVNGLMVCDSCAQGAHLDHPDIKHSRDHYGVSHISNLRRLPVLRTAVLSHEEQEAKLRHGEQGRWRTTPLHDPVGFAIDAARHYAQRVGLPDPHREDFHQVRTNVENLRALGRAYDALPERDPRAIPHFEAMRREVNRQYDHLVNHAGIHVQPVEHDPYRNASEMIDDVKNNRRLQVLKTSVTGGHPIFSDEENDRFRAVHDFYGHAATGRDFDAHGEEAAALAHSRMFSRSAIPALASETRGQNASLHLNGEFGPQKMAILPKHLWVPSSPGARMTKNDVTRMAVRKVAHDSGDGQTIYHCPFCGSGQVIARSDRTIECQFCHVCFTVQVQPQYPAFPQTIDGQPVQVPGMPGQIGAPSVGGGMAADPNDPGAGMVPGSPDEMDSEGQMPPDQEEDAGDEQDNAPPWAKSSLLYRTASGHLLSEQDYLYHLAIKNSPDPKATALRVRAMRKGQGR